MNKFRNQFRIQVAKKHLDPDPKTSALYFYVEFSVLAIRLKSHSLGLDITVKKLTWTIISDADRATVESTWTHIPFLDQAAM
jgi:hypothetical protein